MGRITPTTRPSNFISLEGNVKMNNKATTEVVQTQQANRLDNRMKLYPWYLYNMIFAKNLFHLHNKRIIIIDMLIMLTRGSCMMGNANVVSCSQARQVIILHIDLVVKV